MCCPTADLLVDQYEEVDEPSGFWVTNPPASPIADLVRWAKMR
ncbi:hypothetical protein AB0G87_37730 [Streptomyces asoensis]